MSPTLKPTAPVRNDKDRSVLELWDLSFMFLDFNMKLHSRFFTAAVSPGRTKKAASQIFKNTCKFKTNPSTVALSMGTLLFGIS